MKETNGLRDTLLRSTRRYSWTGLGTVCRSNTAVADEHAKKQNSRQICIAPPRGRPLQSEFETFRILLFRSTGSRAIHQILPVRAPQHFPAVHCRTWQSAESNSPEAHHDD